MSKFIDLTGQKFGRLTVISKYSVSKNGETKWLCKCDCGNTKDIIVSRGNLKCGNVKSCGCYHIEQMKKLKRKYNTYILTGEYGIGYTSNTNKEFYFDLEDYDKIKDYCWYENDQGYILSSAIGKCKRIRMHRLLLNINDSSIIIDHKNTLRYDNRKDNLRCATKQTNGINRPKNKNNKTGHKGVSKSGDKYCARIMKDGKTIEIGKFDDINDAIKARQIKEIELYGEFAYVE